MSTETPSSSQSGTSTIYHLGLFLTTAACCSAAIKLLAKSVWQRSLAGIKKVPFMGETSDTGSYPAAWPPQEVDKTVASTTRSSSATVSQEVGNMITAPKAGSSPATSLPQDVVGAIVAHLIHDTPSLLACSLTSRSWSAAAVPHLHDTLNIYTCKHTYWGEEHKWPNPLQRASKFGWLPLVTRLFIYDDTLGRPWFSLALFHRQTRLEFSELSNVRELYIGSLDIPSFLPTTQQYFGQFSPTVRYLTLINLKGTYRQIVFFVGLFQHLEDLRLNCNRVLEEQEADLTLVPYFVPPLRGRLTAINIQGYDFARTMVDLFGGLRFRHLDISDSCGTQFLV